MLLFCSSDLSTDFELIALLVDKVITNPDPISLGAELWKKRKLRGGKEGREAPGSVYARI